MDFDPYAFFRHDLPDQVQYSALGRQGAQDQDPDFVSYFFQTSNTLERAAADGVRFDFVTRGWGGRTAFDQATEAQKEKTVQRVHEMFQRAGRYLMKVVSLGGDLLDSRTRYFPVQHIDQEFIYHLFDGDMDVGMEEYGESESWTQILRILPELDYIQFVEIEGVGPLRGRPRSRSRSVSRRREKKAKSKSKSRSRSKSRPKEQLPPLKIASVLPGARSRDARETALELSRILPGQLATVQSARRKAEAEAAEAAAKKAAEEAAVQARKKQEKTEEKKRARATAKELKSKSRTALGTTAKVLEARDREIKRLTDIADELEQQGYGINKRKRASEKKKKQTKPKRPKRARQNDVAFFPYLLDSVASRYIDLDYAQIFRETHVQYETKHCLISSLEYFGVDAGLLSDVAQKYQNFALHVPRSCLKEVAEQCRLRISLTTYRNDIDAGTTKTFFTPATYDKTVEMGLFEDHLFPDVPTKYTTFFANNLEKLHSLVESKHLRAEDIYKVVKIDSNGKIKYSPPQKGLSTCALVRCLFKAGYFDKLSPAALIKPKDEEELTEEGVLANQRLWEFERNRKRLEKKEEEEQENAEEEHEDEEAIEDADADALDKGDFIFFAADFESYVQGQHTACMAGCMELELDEPLVTDPTKVRIFEGSDLISQLFSYVANTTRRRESARGKVFTKKVVFFHNLKYDITLFESDPNVQIKSVCEKGGSLYAVNLRFSGMFISVRDSLKMITVGISKFPSAFQLPLELKKQDEFIIYEFFNEDNSEEDFRCTLVDYVGDHRFDGDEEKDSIEKAKFISGLETFLRSKHWLDLENKFSPWKLYQFYLRYDVLVLAGGLHRFNENFKIITEDKLQVLHSLTISSFANRYMGFHGCFKDANEMSLSTRAFQSKAIYGGRVYCTPEFEGRENLGEFDYFDACSLYPTAIKFVCEVKGGFPTGPCQLLREEELNYGFLLRETTEYTVEIRITAIRKKQFSIPFIAHRQKNKSINYLNDLPADGGEVVVTVDRQTLEDYIEFHQIEFEILRGVYWSGSKNPRWGSVIEHLYQERLKCKVAGHGVRSDNLKLIMNSAYGKTIMKTSPTEKVFIPLYRNRKGVRAENPWRLTIFNQLQVTKSFRFVGEHQIELTRFKKDNSYTLSKYGSMILAASKHVMNRVFNLMSDMKLPIYYTDTDSFVIDRSSRLLVADAFRVRYGQELVGDQLGQMHSDFSFKHEGKSISPDLVHSTHFFPMAKKLYLHCLVATMPDGKVHRSIQFKSKGCTQSGLVYKAREYGEGHEGMIGLYRALSQGHTIEVPLNPPGEVRFVYDKDNRVTTDRDKIFYRNIKSEAAQRLHPKPVVLVPDPVYMPEGEFEVEDLIDSD